MKVVITGHMNGLGLALSNKFAEKGYIISGYDLLNNKNTTRDGVVNQLIADCADADIFVNNAYANQSLLLDKIFKFWEGKDKTVINISSAITYSPVEIFSEIFNEYIFDKKKLDNLVHDCRETSSLPYIMNVRPYWFDSQLAKDFNHVKMNPNDIANLIVMLYDMRNTLKILDIVLKK